MVDEMAGPVTAAGALDKLSGLTCYLLPRRASRLARMLRRRAPAAGPGPAPRDAGARGWLPLWAWDPPAARLAVWDYSAVTVAEAEEGRQVAFPTAPALGPRKGPFVPGVTPPAFTVREFMVATPGADDGTGAVAAAAAGVSAQVMLCAAARAALAQLDEQAGNAVADARGSARGVAAHPAGEPLAVAAYAAGGGAVALSVRRPAGSRAPLEAAAAAPGPMAINASAALEAASIELHLDAEPPVPRAGRAARAAPRRPPPCAVGTVSVDFGAGAPYAAVTALHGGSHAVALLFSAASGLVPGALLPPWVLSQLELADAASDGAALALPPPAALVRNAQGEQWLLCCDALATASVGVNLGRLWPRAPQGLRCYYSRGTLLASFKARAPKPGPPRAGAGAPGRASADGAPSGRSIGAARRMRFQDTLTTLTTLEEVEPSAWGMDDGAGGTLSDIAELGTSVNVTQESNLEGGASTASGPASDARGAGSGARPSGAISGENLAAAAAQWAQQSAVPQWLSALLDALSVPWPRDAGAASWQLPPGLSLRGARAAGGRSVAHTVGARDTGLNRAFLWWCWNQGSDGLAKVLAPPPPAAPAPAKDAAAAKDASDAPPAARGCGALAAAARRAPGLARLLAPRAPRPPPLPPVLDGLFTTMVEEMMLRREPLLGSYWHAFSSLDAAGCASVRERNVPLVQFALGTGALSSTPTHHSHMAHSLDTLAACNYVPGNSYRCARGGFGGAAPAPQCSAPGSSRASAASAPCSAR
jgi:hypothetical protein